MKIEHTIKLIGLRFQVSHVSRKKTQLFEEFITDPLNVNARLFVILVRHRQIETVPDGNKIIEVQVI